MRTWLMAAVAFAALVAIAIVLFAPRRRKKRARTGAGARPAARPAQRPAAEPKRAPKGAAVVELAVPEGDDDEADITRVGKQFPGGSSAGEDPSTRAFALILISASGRTDVGRRRALNEDSYLVRDDRQLYVVADGMGGHAAGEVASQLAVETIEQAIDRGQFDGAPNPKLPRLGDELMRVVRMANRAVWDAAQADEAREGMGTTLVAARFAPNKQRVYVAHVGDSRCYRLRNGVLTQLTRDHTYGALGVGGKLGDTLSRAVGYEAEVEVDLTVDAPEPGDRYLLCSDGLSKMMSDDAIRDELGDDADIARTCQRLIAAANERGGKDNVTVVIVRVQRAPLSEIPPPMGDDG